MINLSMAEPDAILRPRIAVMGVGGAGGNAINNMIRSQLEGCDFIAANTDSQAIAMSLAPRKIQLGLSLSRGLGAGSKAEVGRAAAEEQLPEIMACLEGADMLFVTAGMGGGTGTGAAPVIARAARESGILTVGVVTKPFHFEGGQRMRGAESGIADLQQYVDTLIVIPNQNLFRIANERTTFAEAFRLADEVLNAGVRGITDLMVMPGFMNLDFADVKTVMQEMGKAMMGTGEADGDNRAIRAAEAAISNPLLDDISMKGARGVLINITGGMDMTLFEVDQAANRIREEVDPDAQIKVGSTLGEDLGGRIRVSVIATGIDAALAEQQKQRSATSTGRTPQIQTQAVAPVRVSTETAPRTVAAAPVSAPVQAPVQTAAPVVSQPVSVAQPTTTVSMPNVTTSYFSMPQTVTPQMMSQQPVVQEQQPVEVVEAQPQQMTVEQQMHMRAMAQLAAVQAAPAVAPARASYTPAAQPAAPQSAPVASAPIAAQAPIEQAQPAQQNVRMTQIVTPTGAINAQPNQRSQSLFQRITGFGMVRPSETVAEDDDVEIVSTPAAAQQKLSIDSSAVESSDMLDIPAFLRRQSNH